MILLYHMIATLLGFILDRIIGDPPHLPHPVRWIGNGISSLTKRLNIGNYRFQKGVLLTTIVVLTTTSIILAISVVTYQIHWSLYIIVQSIFIAIGLAQKSLQQAAMDVYTPLVAGDLKEARRKLSWIVGRDTDHLDEADITRGVVETVSENTSDGITAPLFYSVFFGATGVWVYKAINTLDSMVGYRNEKYEKFGTCSAKLDDVVNYIPSRLTGLCIVLFTKNFTATSLNQRMKNWLKDAKKHPSPNSGYLEAATAYQLGIQLGGLNYYEGIASHRAEMGKPTVILNASHIQRTIEQMHIASASFLTFMILIGGVIYYVTESWC